MIPGLELLACQDLAVPQEVMEHVVRVESSFNPFAIGVVGARLARQPRSLEEAVATASRLERDGYNFSLGLAQVNRHNLTAQGLESYEDAFAACPNLAAGARILADCHVRAGGDWDKAFSCYYSGNFTRGFRDGYVQKVRRSMAATGLDMIGTVMSAIPLASEGVQARPPVAMGEAADLRARRAAAGEPGPAAQHSRADVPLPSGDGRVANAGPETTFLSGAPDKDPFVPHVTGPQQGPSSPPPAPASPARERRTDSAFVF